jgi:hypothetical protein
VTAIFTDETGAVRLEGTLTGATPAADSPRWATRTLLAAEILDLVANPVEIVPAAGAGNILLPLSGWLHYRPGVVPFDGSADGLGLAYSPQPPSDVTQTGVWNTGGIDGGGFTGTDWLTATEPMVGYFHTSVQQNYYVAADSTDVPLVFANFTPFDLLAGDGTLTVSVLYTMLVSAALV